MTSTEIVAPKNDLRRLVGSGLITLDQLLVKLAEAASQEQPQQENAVPVVEPKAIVLSDEERKVLRTLPAQLADLQLPSEPRALTPGERTQLVPVFVRVKEAQGAVDKAIDALREVMHNHIDANSPEDTPVDGNGHKITRGEVVADGFHKKIVRDVRGGQTVNLTEADLRVMEEEGALTHAEYLKATKAIPTRELVPNALMAVIAARPELIDAFADRARFSKQTTAIRAAKA